MISGIREKTMGLVCSEHWERLYGMRLGRCAGAQLCRASQDRGMSLGLSLKSLNSPKGLKHKADIILICT